MSETRFQYLFGTGSGTGSRPAAGNAGARWIDTTGPTETYDNGSTWVTLGGTSSAALTLIDSHIVGASPEASYTNSSLGSHKHLLLKVVARSDAAGTTNTDLRVQFNSDTTSGHYAWSGVTGSGGAPGGVGSGSDTAMSLGLLTAATATASYAGAYQATIFDYNAANWMKWAAAIGFWASGGSFQLRDYCGGWLSTAAITAIKVFPASGNFIQNSRIELWGID